MEGNVTNEETRAEGVTIEEETITLTKSQWRKYTDEAINASNSAMNQVDEAKGSKGNPIAKMMITMVALHTTVQLEKRLFPKEL